MSANTQRLVRKKTNARKKDVYDEGPRPDKRVANDGKGTWARSIYVTHFLSSRIEKKKIYSPIYQTQTPQSLCTCSNPQPNMSVISSLLFILATSAGVRAQLKLSRTYDKDNFFDQFFFRDVSDVNREDPILSYKMAPGNPPSKGTKTNMPQNLREPTT